MKTVILAGGFGTRISEESYLKPKPMIEIGDKPILWHIMKLYSHHGFNEFVICCGYKGYLIKEYFANYFLHRCDVTFDFTCENKMTIHSSVAEPWQVTLVDTGLETMTGGRIKRIRPYIGDEPFMLTYGDGVSDENIAELVKFHKSHGKYATLSAIQPEGRFGILDTEGDRITAFREKRREDTGWVNSGFMVLEPQVFDYIDGDQISFEKEPLETLSREKQLMVYRHYGYWQCMDTQRDKRCLEDLWASGEAPWKVWAE